MELYIGNIPDGIDDYDLRKLFRVSGDQASFRIVCRDGGHNKSHYYGLANIASDKLALKLARHFNGLPFKDKRLVVKTFTHRNYSNDRRALNWREQDWQKTERRQRDRRGMLMQGRRSVSQGAAVFHLG